MVLLLIHALAAQINGFIICDGRYNMSIQLAFELDQHDFGVKVELRFMKTGQ